MSRSHRRTNQHSSSGEKTGKVLSFLNKFAQLRRKHRQITAALHRSLRQQPNFLSSQEAQNNFKQLQLLDEIIKYTEPHYDQAIRYIIFTTSVLLVFFVIFLDYRREDKTLVSIQLRVSEITWKNTRETDLSLSGSDKSAFSVEDRSKGNSVDYRIPAKKIASSVELDNIELQFPQKTNLRIVDTHMLELTAKATHFNLRADERDVSAPLPIVCNHINLLDPNRWDWSERVYADRQSLDFTEHVNKATTNSSIISGKIILEELKENIEVNLSDTLHVWFDKDVALHFSGIRDTINIQFRGYAQHVDINGRDLMPTWLRLWYNAKAYWFYIIPIFFTIITTLLIRPRRGI